MAQSVLGLDIGGANLKAAHTSGVARLVPFALWKEPHRLADELCGLIGSLPRFERLAVTMTGELCDCYESKRQGVHAILDAVETAAPAAAIRVWRNDGRFVDVPTARQTPLQVAAANWLALATYAGRFAPEGPALLLDIGSTTTDIVPLRDGQPIPRGRTDPERLSCNELVYTGVRRTPLCAILPSYVATELFATMLDVYLVLGAIPEDVNDRDTADGRSATNAPAHARLARMLCADLETSTEEERYKLAFLARQHQGAQIAAGVELVCEQMPSSPTTVISAGSGEFLAPAIVKACASLSPADLVSLGSVLGAEASRAGPAHALAVLAAEQCDAIR
jgi:probable H4MPT-linked C1 transfer pathway protein